MIFINYLTQLPGLVFLGFIFLIVGATAIALIDSVSEDLKKSRGAKK